MREEKKYEVLPGVELPDIKAINAAASDFSISEVGDVDVKATQFTATESIADAAVPAVTAEELAQLQSLGNKVAEDEARSQAESRKKMDAIMSKAVHASESISDLKSSNITKANEEKRKAIEDSLKAEQEQKAEEDAKNKAREERRLLQQRLLEEAKERAAKEAAEKAEAEAKRAAEEAAAKEAAEKAAQEAEEREIREAAERAVREALEYKKPEPEEVKPAEEPAIQTAVETPAEAPVAVETAPAVEEPKTEEPKAEEKKEEEVKAEAPKAEEPNKPRVPIWEQKRTTTIASSEETFDDFKEFLDDDF